MKSRTITIAASIAALTFASTPVIASAATHPPHRSVTASQLDRSRDAGGVRHIDKSRDDSRDRADNSIDGLDH